MPLYEGIGIISEKHAIVLDFGSVSTKVGYAGESHPRKILPTPSNLFEKCNDESELYDRFVPFIHQIYFRVLLVNPKDRRVVLVESVIGNSRITNVLAKVLFKHFEVLSVLFAPSHLMPLFTLGIKTGLVLDVGFHEATLIPIYEGVPILKAWQAQPLASKAIQERLREKLKRDNLTDKTIEDIVLRLCFVTSLKRGSLIQEIEEDASSVPGLSSKLNDTVPNVRYPLGGSESIDVDGAVRESVCEVMFEKDQDFMSVSTMILDAILACPIDTRKKFAENIIFMGGTSMIPGFKARVIQEVNELLKDERYKSVNIDCFKVHRPPARENYVAWSGASIFGATDAITTRSLIRDLYLKDEVVPDWANLRFNLQGNDASEFNRKG